VAYQNAWEWSVKKAASGGRYVSTSLGERLAQELAGDSERPVHERLSDREYQIMWMIASGKTVGEVAEQRNTYVSPGQGQDRRTVDRLVAEQHDGLGGRLARHPGAHAVDVSQLVNTSVPTQAKRIGAKGVCLNDLRAGLQILLVNTADKVWRREIQLVITTIDENALGIQQGTHGAVT